MFLLLIKLNFSKLLILCIIIFSFNIYTVNGIEKIVSKKNTLYLYNLFADEYHHKNEIDKLKCVILINK
jgi:hypothetical protein